MDYKTIWKFTRIFSDSYIFLNFPFLNLYIYTSLSSQNWKIVSSFPFPPLQKKTFTRISKFWPRAPGLTLENTLTRSHVSITRACYPERIYITRPSLIYFHDGMVKRIARIYLGFVTSICTSIPLLSLFSKLESLFTPFFFLHLSLINPVGEVLPEHRGNGN